MFTSDKYISPPSLVLKLKSCQVVHKWIPRAEKLKRIFTPKGCKCKQFCLQTRFGEICSTDVIMQLQILVTALISVMKTLGSTSSVYFCCVLALTLFSVPPAGSSFSSSGRWRRCASIVMAHGIRYGLCRYSHDRKGLFLDFQKSPFCRFNMARDEVRPLATSSYAWSLAKTLVLSTSSKSSSFPKPRVLPAVLFAHHKFSPLLGS